MPKLSILIPVYNEEKTVALVLDNVMKVKLNKIKKEIIIVNNASTDNTLKILEDYRKSKNKEIKIISHKKNLGKGSSIRTGLKHATGDIILIQDADLEYDPKEYPKLLKPIIDGKADVVYGSRLMNREKVEYARFVYYVGAVSLTKIFWILYGKNVSDVCCGYKLFRSNIIKGINLKCRHFEFDCEATAKISKSGHEIYDVPISYRPRSRKEGKKINFLDWLKSAYVMAKYRFTD